MAGIFHSTTRARFRCSAIPAMHCGIPTSATSFIKHLSAAPRPHLLGPAYPLFKKKKVEKGSVPIDRQHSGSISLAASVSALSNTQLSTDLREDKSLIYSDSRFTTNNHIHEKLLFALPPAFASFPLHRRPSSISPQPGPLIQAALKPSRIETLSS